MRRRPPLTVLVAFTGFWLFLALIAALAGQYHIPDQAVSSRPISAVSPQETEAKLASYSAGKVALDHSREPRSRQYHESETEKKNRTLMLGIGFGLGLAYLALLAVWFWATRRRIVDTRRRIH
jgi:DNA-binding IclR family transcriptional regulator